VLWEYTAPTQDGVYYFWKGYPVTIGTTGLYVCYIENIPTYQQNTFAGNFHLLALDPENGFFVTIKYYGNILR
jgi:hypothetical protein